MPGSPDLSVDLGSMRLDNPVMPASGTFGYGQEYAPFLDLNRLGAVVVKTLTLEPRLGSFPTRCVEVPSGMLSSIGLQNVGVRRFVQDKLPFFTGLETRLIVSVGGFSVAEYTRVAAVLEREDRVDAMELNVSCPNIRHGGMHFGADPESLRDLVRRVRDVTSKVLLVKLTPMVTDIRVPAEICQGCGADGLSLINAPKGMVVDVRTRRPKLGRNVSGGLTGPAIRPLALYLVRQVCRSVDIPVVGIGGIASAEDALEFIVAGASAVQIGTWNFVNPRATLDVIEGIREYLRQEGGCALRDIIGTLETGRPGGET